MLLSIAVYTLTGLVLFALGKRVCLREERCLRDDGAMLPFYSWEMLASIAVFAIVAGCRYHTGFDHAMYLKQFQMLQESGAFTRDNFEPGFKLITKAFAYSGCHYALYFAFWAALQIGLLYYGLKDRKFLLPWVALGIMLGPYFIEWMNSMRQAVACCMLVALVPLMQERKFLPYALAVAVMAFVHKSALLLLLIYFMPRIPVRINSSKVLMAILVVCILAGLKPVWVNLLVYVQNALDMIGYGRYERLVGLVASGEYRFVNFGPNHIEVLFVDFCIIWFYPKVKECFKDDKMLPLFFAFAFVGMCLENLLLNTVHFMLRPIDYFRIFILIMNAYTLEYLFRSKNRAMFWLLAVVAFSYTYVVIFKAVYMPTIVNVPVLYHLFFMN